MRPRAAYHPRQPARPESRQELPTAASLAPRRPRLPTERGAVVFLTGEGAERLPMSMTILISIVVCLLGLAMYLACAPPPVASKAARVGELMFFAGLLVALFELGSKVLHF